MKVFIVVLNWNRAEDTIECLKSINKLKVKGFEYKVVIVDNASSDDSVGKIKGFIKDSGLYKLIINSSNLGFAEGNNVGMRYALNKEADFVMILNNDTILDPSIITRFLDAARKYPKAGILSPKIYFAKGYEFHKGRYKEKETGKVIWYAGGAIDWDNVYGVNRGVDEVDIGQYEKTDEIDFATGACMFVRCSALKKVGFFDRKYFMYMEDDELSLRMKKQGYSVIYVPKAYLWHKVAQSSGIGSGLNDYFLTRNRIVFALNYAPVRAKFAVFRESIKFLFFGRPWQKRGAIDFYLRKFGKGSWK